MRRLWAQATRGPFDMPTAEKACAIAEKAAPYMHPRLGVVQVNQTLSIEARIANMTREERLARMAELLAPMRQYLHELDDEAEIAADAEVTTIESSDGRRRRRPSAA